jgi:hypothetical protein
MRFVIFKGEKSVGDLATRIFHNQGSGTQAAANLADVLVKTNPQLADLSKVPLGSLIAVPDNAPAISPDEQVIVSGVARTLAAQTVQSAFDALQQRLTAIEGSAANRLTSALDRTQTPDFLTALKNLSDQRPELVGHLPTADSIAQDTADVMKDLQAAQALRKQSLAQLQAALASFPRK